MAWTTEQLVGHPNFGKLVRVDEKSLNENRRQSQSPVAKQAVRDESLAAEKRKRGNAGRVSVRIVSYRQRLTDPDNLVGKYFLDCCRYAGFLRDDTAAEIVYSIAQEKTGKEFERTEIIITGVE